MACVVATLPDATFYKRRASALGHYRAVTVETVLLGLGALVGVGLGAGSVALAASYLMVAVFAASPELKAMVPSALEKLAFAKPRQMLASAVGPFGLPAAPTPSPPVSAFTFGTEQTAAAVENSAVAGTESHLPEPAKSAENVPLPPSRPVHLSQTQAMHAAAHASAGGAVLTGSTARVRARGDVAVAVGSSLPTPDLPPPPRSAPADALRQQSLRRPELANASSIPRRPTGQDNVTRAPMAVARFPVGPAARPFAIASPLPTASASPNHVAATLARNNSISLSSYDSHTAIYDIAAHTVYLPNGERLEAHSGLGAMLDNPHYVNEKGRGATPPNLYNLTLRRQIFHGIQAIRLNPIGDSNMFGRNGLLAHTYMLGRSGQSFGCVSFRNYPEFLRAFLGGKIDRLIVVPNLVTAPAGAARARRDSADRYALNDR